MCTTAFGQDPRPHLGFMGGLGNVLGGLGAGAEYDLPGGRISAGGGLGFWPTGCDQATFSAAGALRGFAGGRRHRAFLELSYSLIAISCAVFSDDIERHYGPGLSLGYRYIGSDGFTFTAAGGIGDPSGDSGSEAIILLGLGYTWRR
ncbi:MAG: hypothetical protein ACJ8BC_08890 [Gemmatimonadales bacterium]